MTNRIAKHPDDLLAANDAKLRAWLADAAAEQPCIAIGAIGERVAAAALGAEVVSDRTHGHDLTIDGLLVEVKAMMVGRRWSTSLGGKDSTHVARVVLGRRPAIDRPDELWAERVELRPRWTEGNGPADGGWAPVAGFQPHPVA